MSKSRLTQAVVLGALLAAASLATMTAVAHATSEPTLTHDSQRPPTQGQVGEAWHRRSVVVNQYPVAGDMRRPPTEGQVGEAWHPRVSVPMRLASRPASPAAVSRPWPPWPPPPWRCPVGWSPSGQAGGSGPSR